MMKRMKKILLANILICVLLINICRVSAYDFVKPGNEEIVHRDRIAIHELVDLYYDIVGGKGGNILIGNYSGICSFVNVQGTGTFDLETYIAGVVKAEMGAERDKPEALKAQAVAARSFLLNSMKNRDSCTVVNGESFQAFKEPDLNSATDQPYIDAARQTAGQVILRNGEPAFTQYSSYSPNNVEVNGKWNVTMYKFGADPSSQWTWVGPSKQTVANANNYFGSKTGHRNGMSQAINGYLASIGKTYEEILTLFYGTSDTALGVLPDGAYTGEISYVDSEFGRIRMYYQGDFSAYYYSSDVSKKEYGSATIASHGCGPTSLAIVFSSFSGTDIGPITTTQDLCKIGGCTSGGSYWGSLKQLAENYGYKTELVNRNNPQRVIQALGTGKALVVAYMGPGTFTNGGHYIVLTGSRSDGYVSVADPGSRSRTSTKWFSYNTVVEQSHTNTNSPFMIITK